MRFLRDNGLSLAFGGIFLAALVGEAIVGHVDFNHLQAAHNDQTISLWRYVTSSDYAADVTENWQSEYLQFTLYIVATAWLVQRGSAESKQPGDEGPESDEEQRSGRHAGADSPLAARAGGALTSLYSHSLALTMGAIWLVSWFAQAVAGRAAYNADQFDHRESGLSLVHYVGSSDFWNRTLQNWQSEFLAVGSMAALSIYLRQRGSPESKAVGAPHAETGSASG